MQASLASINHAIVFADESTYALFISKYIGALNHRDFWKHSLCTTFLLVLTMDEVCNISNKYQFPNSPLGLFIGDIFRNIHFFLLVLIHSSFICNKIGVFIAKLFKNPFFTTFLLVLEWVRCAIFQMNTDFLMS